MRLSISSVNEEKKMVPQENGAWHIFPGNLRSLKASHIVAWGEAGREASATPGQGSSPPAAEHASLHQCGGMSRPDQSVVAFVHFGAARGWMRVCFGLGHVPM
jgi:hypothetical protein